jgi:hypothetical protein
MKESSFTAMVESYWLANAHSAFTTPLNPDTGEMRYCTTHTRAFHKSLGDLLKLRSERRKAKLASKRRNTKPSVTRWQKSPIKSNFSQKT